MNPGSRHDELLHTPDEQGYLAIGPAGFEHFVELLRQGSGAMQRVAVASRALQREAHRTVLLTKASLGAAYSILDRTEGPWASPEWAGMAQRELRRNRASWDQ